MEKKVSVLVATLVLGCLVWGQQPNPVPIQPPMHQSSEMRSETFVMRTQAVSNMLVRTGGYLEVPSSRVEGKRICIINAQKDLEEGVVRDAKREVEKILRHRIDIITDEKAAKPMERVAVALKHSEIAAVLLICSNEEYPMMLVAPDDRWAILNVCNMKNEKTDKGLFEKRVNKQIWRSLGFLLGASVGIGDKCLMSPVSSVADLDQLEASAISPMPMQKMIRYAEHLGVMQTKLTTYRKACEEGWAPIPTNSFQKAIWEEVKGKKKE
jgi:predicted Zn-dependent protease